MIKSTIIAVAFMLSAGILRVSAQDKTPSIDQREKNQEKRIEQGVKSGELTPGETRRLEIQQGKIKADEAKAKSDGKVTPAERRKLKRELNRANRNIFRKKHNARVNPDKQP